MAMNLLVVLFFFFSSRRRHTRLQGDWSSDVCSSDLHVEVHVQVHGQGGRAFAVRIHVQGAAGQRGGSQSGSSHCGATGNGGTRQGRGACRLVERSEEHTSELQSPCKLVCRLLLEKTNIVGSHCSHVTAAENSTGPAASRFAKGNGNSITLRAFCPYSPVPHLTTAVGTGQTISAT